MNIFSNDSMLGRFLLWTADIFILNILWFIFSLPLFTIGASTTALYYSLMIRTRRDEGYIHKNFFKSFKLNFVQSTIIWVILVLIGIIIFIDFRVGLFLNAANNSPVGKIILLSSIIIMIPYFFILMYIFPVQAKFINKITDNLKNSLLMAIGHLGYTFILILITLSFFLLTFISRAFIGIEILFGFGLYAYITSNIYITVFRKHLPQELEEDLEALGIQNQDI